MESFKFLGDVIQGYHSCTERFVNIAADDMRSEVEAALAGGSLWPEPPCVLLPEVTP